MDVDEPSRCTVMELGNPVDASDLFMVDRLPDRVGNQPSSCKYLLHCHMLPTPLLLQVALQSLGATFTVRLCDPQYLWCTAFNPGTFCKPWQKPGLNSVRLCQVAFINGRIMEFASTVEAAEGCLLAHPVNEAAQVGTNLLQDRLWWR